MIRISQLKLKVGHTREELFEEIIHQAHGKRPVSWRIVRKSVDARKKPQLFYVYTIDAEFENEKKLLSAKKSKWTRSTVVKYRFPYNKKDGSGASSTEVSTIDRAVIVGMGPAGLFAACGKKDTAESCNATDKIVTSSAQTENGNVNVDLSIFAAKSLNSVMDEICAAYTKEHPNVNFQNNYDSSGTLMAQIKEGAKCNIFFSAGVAQMDELQNGYEAGSVVDDSRVDLLNNQVCLVTYKNSGTAVTSFADISKAKNMALADGTVPVGQYTRVALVNSKMVEGDASKPQDISDSDISKALGGLEINSCANVGAVASAVAEGANEIGTVYYSDTFGYENQLDIIEKLPNSLTGDVIYPIAALKGDSTTSDELEAAKEFIAYLQTDEAMSVFEKYHFSVNA